MSQIGKNIQENFAHSDPRMKPRIQQNITQMTRNLIEASQSLTKAYNLINLPQNAGIEAVEKLQPRLGTWHDEFSNANLAYRRELSKLFSDFKYMIGSLPNSDDLFEELDSAQNELKEGWTDPGSYTALPYGSKENLEQILSIADPNSNSTFEKTPNFPLTNSDTNIHNIPSFDKFTNITSVSRTLQNQSTNRNHPSEIGSGEKAKYDSQGRKILTYEEYLQIKNSKTHESQPTFQTHKPIHHQISQPITRTLTTSSLLIENTTPTRYAGGYASRQVRRVPHISPAPISEREVVHHHQEIPRLASQQLPPTVTTRSPMATPRGVVNRNTSSRIINGTPTRIINGTPTRIINGTPTME